MRTALARIAVAVAALSSAFVVSSCAPDRECLHGHSEPTIIPVFTGKTTVFVPGTRFECDEYAP